MLTNEFQIAKALTAPWLQPTNGFNEVNEKSFHNVRQFSLHWSDAVSFKAEATLISDDLPFVTDARPHKRKTPEEPHDRGVALRREDDGSHWRLPEIEHVCVLYPAAADFFSLPCSNLCLQAEATKRWPLRRRVPWDDIAFELGVKDTERKRKSEEALVAAIWHSVAAQAVRIAEKHCA